MKIAILCDAETCRLLLVHMYYPNFIVARHPRSSLFINMNSCSIVTDPEYTVTSALEVSAYCGNGEWLHQGDLLQARPITKSVQRLWHLAPFLNYEKQYP
jgi:hypothetical protein